MTIEATTQQGASTRARITALDALRGVALILMGLVHVAAFVRANVQAETYGGEPAVLQSWPYWLTALFTTVAAPVFWTLSGVSVALLEASRRRAGETEGDITRFLVIRAGLLLLLDLTIADWAWTGGGPYTHILLSLGLSLIVLSLARRLPPMVLGGALAVIVIGYQLALPWIAAHLSQTPDPLLALFLGYRTHPWPALEFSLLGWGPLMGIGYLLGRYIDRPVFRRPRTWLAAGAGLLAIAFGLRALGGFGDLVPFSPEQGWVHFVVMSKTPPSLTYFTFKLGLASLVLAALVARAEWLVRAPASWLVMCGQASLFFFVMHIVVYNLVSQGVLALNLPGPGIIRVYLAWALGLVVLVPLTTWYRGVRRANPRSLLRYL
ncbi:MAG TPA: acyltransferase family protein [Anaerolineales bacterium]|nr:acyltransferase family protein [Anaerolineales bacterium]